MIDQGRPVNQFYVAFGGSVRDVDIVAGSVPSADLPSAVSALLRAHARLQQSGNLPMPGWSLSYYRLPDDTAVVLRRSGKGHSPGRGNSHALVGAVADLTPDTVLRLGTWSGWRDECPPGPFPELDLGELPKGLAETDHDLRARARISPWLGYALTFLLADPTTDLSIIGCPDDDRLPLLWGLYEIGLRFPKLDRRAWTFSSYEVGREELENLPEIIFLPGDPVGSVRGDNRRQLDLGTSTSAATERTGEIDALVALYRRTGTVSAQPSDAAQLVAHVPVHPAAPSSVDPGCDHSRPCVQEYSEPWDPADPARALVRALCADSFDSALETFTARCDGAADRGVLRQALAEAGHRVEAIEALPLEERPARYEQLLVAAFGVGFADVKDGRVRQAIRDLVLTTSSHSLRDAAGRLAQECGQSWVIASELKRARQAQSEAVVEAGPGRSPTPLEAGQRRPPRPARSPEYRRLVIAGAGTAAVLGAVAFATGLWIGGLTAGSAAATASRTAPASTAAPPGPTATIGPVTVNQTRRTVTGTWQDLLRTQRLYLALQDQQGAWYRGAECPVLLSGSFTCDYEQPQAATTTLVLLAVDAAGLPAIADQLVGTSPLPPGALQLASAPSQ